MKSNPYTANIEKLIIELYDKKELTPAMLTGIMREMSDCFIDPEQATRLQSNDGKNFKEVVCCTILPLAHQEIMETSRKINKDGGYIWMNLQKAEDLFEYIWFDELNMPDTEYAASNRPIIPVD